MIAPVVPFVTDEIYTKLTGEKSVHLSEYPKYDAQLIDEHIANDSKMEIFRNSGNKFDYLLQVIK